ncbi:MAG TPA: protein kinase [Gemmataceae bacterium]|jgi:serine/threonine-protein kinase
MSPQEREQRLDEVLASYLRARQEGATPDRQELLAAHPELADELTAFFADQDSFARLAAPLRCLTPVSPLSGPRDFGDYEIIEEIARGGMGVVFKAKQKSLGRVVALKMLLAGPWASAADLQRFRAEAEAAAQLDHPNIVPIHEVGTHDDHPYLSMKFVEGGSLTHRLATSGRRPCGREAAWLTTAVADAIHYAHQRGILHRDLKPANILLARQNTESGVRNERHEASAYRILHPAFCVPMVTDFGLAKRTPRPSCPEAPPRSALSEVPTRPYPQVLTQTGAIIGTPGYMAPEQACGSPAAITTAADVYGLGAVLYEILTGRPPFQGTTPLDTVRQLLEQEPIRPSVHNSAVDRDVETICLKCLQKEPARRYASARELADDLRRYLSGESILARPVGPLTRTWRLARRQPIVAALMLALLLVVLGALSSVTFLWLRADKQRQLAERHFRTAEQQRDEARQAREQAEMHRRDAESNFRLAHQAVHDFSRRINEELQNEPRSQPLRKSLLQAALNYYRDFLRQRDQDPALRLELAETYSQMGRLVNDLGSRAEALAACKEAATLFRELQQAHPDNVQYQILLGGTLISLGMYEDSAEASFARFQEAHAVYRRFLATHADNRSLRSGLAVTLGNIGTATGRLGRPTEAADWYRQACDLLEPLLQESPNSTEMQTHLANVLIRYGDLCNRHGIESREEALRLVRRALELRTALAEKRPRDVLRQADLAEAYLFLAQILRDAGHQIEAIHEFQQSLDIREKLARENPLVPRYQKDVAFCLTELGALHHGQNHLEQALSHFLRARDKYQTLFDRDANSRQIRFSLAKCWFRASIIQGALRRRSEEYQSLSQARDLEQLLVKLDPNNLDYRHELSQTLNNMGANLKALNRRKEALPLIREALEHMRLVIARAPRVTAYRKTITIHWNNLIATEKDLGHTRAAAEALRERGKLWPDKPNELHHTARELAIVADAVGGGKTELTTDEQAERQQDIEDALTMLRQAISHGFNDVARLQKDKAFDSLRSNESFRALVRELEKQAPTKSAPPSTNAPDMTKRK